MSGGVLPEFGGQRHRHPQAAGHTGQDGPTSQGTSGSGTTSPTDADRPPASRPPDAFGTPPTIARCPPGSSWCASTRSRVPMAKRASSPPTSKPRSMSTVPKLQPIPRARIEQPSGIEARTPAAAPAVGEDDAPEWEHPQPLSRSRRPGPHREPQTRGHLVVEHHHEGVRAGGREREIVEREGAGDSHVAALGIPCGRATLTPWATGGVGSTRPRPRPAGRPR
jgi:hypothetical protein